MGKKYSDYRGLRGLVAAEVLTDNGTTFTADKWQELEGAVSCNVEGEESTATIYRDNLAVRNINTEGADTATVNMDVLANKVRAWLEGRTYSETNDVYIKTPKKIKQYVFGFIGEKSDGTEEAVIIYNTTVTGGNEERNTKDDGTDVTTVEYVFTGTYTKTKFDIDGKKVPVKSVTVPLSAVVTEEKLFGTFTDGESDTAPLTPDAIVALTA
jgi:phi13 family phage major tail protein